MPLLDDAEILLRFNDGAEGEVDLKDALYGEVFEPLQDLEKYKSFQVDPDLETVVWENGADLAPEFLYGNGGNRCDSLYSSYDTRRLGEFNMKELTLSSPSKGVEFFVIDLGDYVTGQCLSICGGAIKF